MIHTLISKPNPLLSDCICYYAIREFDCNGGELLKPVCAKDEIHLMFMINSKMADFRNAIGFNSYHLDTTLGPDCVFSGVLTANTGWIVFQSHVKLLTIHFKPIGFFRLFGISPAEITDVLGESTDLLAGSVTRLHERLQEPNTNEEVIQLADNFLLGYLLRRKAGKDSPCLLKVTEFLLKQPGMYPVDQLAYSANMSLKTFERRFLEQVGVYPKLFERLRRFTQALNLKVYNPDMSWTEICFLSGYYDQNHLIKEFSKFTGRPPVEFFKIPHRRLRFLIKKRKSFNFHHNFESGIKFTYFKINTGCRAFSVIASVVLVWVSDAKKLYLPGKAVIIVTSFSSAKSKIPVTMFRFST
jgi:AraC-like DNA-binding protein